MDPFGTEQFPDLRGVPPAPSLPLNRLLSTRSLSLYFIKQKRGEVPESIAVLGTTSKRNEGVNPERLLIRVLHFLSMAATSRRPFRAVREKRGTAREVVET